MKGIQSNMSAEEIYASNKYPKNIKNYAENSSVFAVFKNCMEDFRAGRDSIQSELSKAKDLKDIAIKQYSDVQDCLKEASDIVTNQREQIQSLTEENNAYKSLLDDASKEVVKLTYLLKSERENPILFAQWLNNNCQMAFYLPVGEWYYVNKDSERIRVSTIELFELYNQSLNH